MVSLMGLKRFTAPCFYFTIIVITIGLVINMTVVQFIPVVLDRLALRPNIPSRQCHYCFNTTDVFTIGNQSSCDTDLFLLIIVTSHAANLDARGGIRNTWGNITEYKGYKIKTMFMFGIHPDRNFNNLLKHENTQHGDVIQGNFADSYKTLTEKSIVALKWATRYCKPAKYILKTDDDSFNNPGHFIDYLTVYAKDPYFIGGYCFTVRPDRRISSKWYVTFDTYPDAYYPVYCSGPAYIVSQQAASVLVEVSPHVLYVNMEDVYVTGLCRHTAKLQYYQLPGIQASKGRLGECDLATWVLNIHQVPPHDMVRLWDQLHKGLEKNRCNWFIGKRYIVLVIFLILWGYMMKKIVYSKE